MSTSIYSTNSKKIKFSLQLTRQIRECEQILTVMLSRSLAICLIISPWCAGWVCSSFLMTTTLSATTISVLDKTNY